MALWVRRILCERRGITHITQAGCSPEANQLTPRIDVLVCLWEIYGVYSTKYTEDVIIIRSFIYGFLSWPLLSAKVGQLCNHYICSYVGTYIYSYITTLMKVTL